MTERTFNKIKAGLQDAIDGNWSGVTFIGVDLAKDQDFSAVVCPRCGAGNAWRDVVPTACAGCGVRFHIR